MLCSANAGWYHQALDKSGVGGTGFTGGAGRLKSFNSIKSGIETESLLTVCMVEVDRGALGQLGSSLYEMHEQPNLKISEFVLRSER